MNYYERHLGDYAKDAGHLTQAEHGAYTLLLDRYYATDQPIPQDQVHRITRARSPAEKAAADNVVSEFFRLVDGTYRNCRADEEITKARTKINAARANGKSGGRPKKNPEETQQQPSGLLLGSETITQPKALQTPDTRQRPSEAIASGGGPPIQPDSQDVVFALGVPLLTAAGVKESNARSFLAMQCKAHGARLVADALEACAATKPIQPISWIQDHLKPKSQTGKHSGFESKNYREGITEDGLIA